MSQSIFFIFVCHDASHVNVSPVHLCPEPTQLATCTTGHYTQPITAMVCHLLPLGRLCRLSLALACGSSDFNQRLSRLPREIRLELNRIVQILQESVTRCEDDGGPAIPYLPRTMIPRDVENAVLSFLQPLPAFPSWIATCYDEGEEDAVNPEEVTEYFQNLVGVLLCRDIRSVVKVQIITILQGMINSAKQRIEACNESNYLVVLEREWWLLMNIDVLDAVDPLSDNVAPMSTLAHTIRESAPTRTCQTCRFSHLFVQSNDGYCTVCDIHVTGIVYRTNNVNLCQIKDRCSCVNGFILKCDESHEIHDMQCPSCHIPACNLCIPSHLKLCNRRMWNEKYGTTKFLGCEDYNSLFEDSDEEMEE